MVHDAPLWISIGRNRKETSWKNKQLLWSALCKRLNQAVKTDETYKEYTNLPKDIQAEKKDVGGFVGGSISGGRRKVGAVTTRSLLTLDIDFAPSAFWDVFQLYYDSAAFLYATHSHSPDKPRYRLIMPLSREVLVDEHEAIARKVAGMLDINFFDDTTFQGERLMYWPSVSKDVQYYRKFQDGPFLNADKVLKSYKDWKDVSQWPTSTRVTDSVRKRAKEQGDPLEKPGVIGAFCRTYSIEDVLETYLSDVYEATEQDDRYTYVEGSTAAGLVLYEGKFAYSHHGTDPISGKLCNAFDLVRIHKFGSLDPDDSSDMTMNKRPSFKAMADLAVKDKAVSKELSITRMQEAGLVFAEGEDTDWLKELEKDRAGNVLSTINNSFLILKHDPALKGCFAYNAFTQRDVAIKDLPWRVIIKTREPLIDKDDACLRKYLEKNYNVSAAQKIQDGMTALMVENSFHPVRDYLNGLTWDKKDRIDTLLIDLFGAEDTEYNRAVIRKTLVGAVARIFQPGIKFDNVLTLVGQEGKYKSTFFKLLGGEWFSDSFGPLDNLGKAMEQLQGSWIIEIAELAGFRRADIETVKHFVSKQEDRYRPAYGRRIEEFPRQCIFVATTNKIDFLNDSTGDRRYWPVLIGVNEHKRNVRDNFTAGEVRQVWAEAVQLYKDKESLHLPIEIEIASAKEKSSFRESDERESKIDEYLEMPVPEEWYTWGSDQRQIYIDNKDDWSGSPIYKATGLEIWEWVFNGRVKDANRQAVRFIKEYFAARNKVWSNKVIKIGKRSVRGYYRLGTVTKGDYEGLLQ